VCRLGSIACICTDGYRVISTSYVLKRCFCLDWPPCLESFSLSLLFHSVSLIQPSTRSYPLHSTFYFSIHTDYRPSLLPRDAMHRAHIRTMQSQDVCLAASITFWYCVKTATYVVEILSPSRIPASQLVSEINDCREFRLDEQT